MATVVQMTFRVILSFLFAYKLGITGIAYACFGGWIAMLLYEVPVYLKLRKDEKKF
jgi:Na+-driven multidrug efflux pump